MRLSSMFPKAARARPKYLTLSHHESCQASIPEPANLKNGVTPVSHLDIAVLSAGLRPGTGRGGLQSQLKQVQAC